MSNAATRSEATFREFVPTPWPGRILFLAILGALLAVHAPSRASATPAGCATAIAKAASRHSQARSKQLAQCARRAASTGSPTTAADCLTDATVVSALAAIDADFAGEIHAACGGADEVCGAGDDEPLAAIGWDLGTCPDFGGAGCTMPISSCSDIITCLSCMNAAAVSLASTFAGELVPSSGADVEGCQAAIVGVTERFYRDRTRALAKCRWKVATGRIAGPCPDENATRTLARRSAKAAEKVCRSCGGADQRCDGEVAANPGSGGGDDPLLSNLTSRTECPSVIVPSTGADCGGALATPSDAIGCAQCLASHASECTAAAGRPSAGGYPVACRGTSTAECPECLLWSDPATWGGTLPQADEDIDIPADRQILLDVDTPALGVLTVYGTLRFARQDVSLTAEAIMVHGTMAVGSEAEPFAQKATITLDAHDPNQSVMGMGTRGIMVMGGGTLSLHGTPPNVAWTKIADHVDAGQSDISLSESVNWTAGDQIVLAPTDFHTRDATAARAVTERLTVSSSAGTQLATTSGPSVSRWGVLQYPTATGVGLAPDPGLVLPPAMAGTPMVLDERAEIGNLTRNIVIQSPDDALWQDEGFGVHIMVMNHGSQAFLDGVEIRRGGQRGALGRYPFHWHMLSYDPPLWVGDATGQYIRNSVIHESMNRGIVVHGTNGVLVQNNIVYDVLGHGIFTEDASERRNTFDRNLVLRVRNPAEGDALKQHELEFGSPGVQGGSSGFWISNPDNTITENTAADCEGMGFWLAFTFRVWGASAPTTETRVPITPRNIALREFDRNTAHSVRFRGLLLDLVESDADGRVGVPGTPQQYIPSDDADGYFGNPALAYANRIPFELTRFTVWKAGLNGIWDRASGPRNREIVSADNSMKFFAGSGEDGLIERSLLIGTSLNAPTERSSHAGDPTPSGFATYHSAFDIQNNLVINFPLTPGQTSGAFAEDDFYIRPVEKGTFRNSGNVLINSHPGYKSVALAAGTGSYQPFASWFNFAPAKWDPHGWAGPAGNWLVYDTPFHTYGLGAALQPVAPNAIASGAVSAPGPYYGFLAFSLHGVGDALPMNQDYNDLMEIHVRRHEYDAMSQSLTEVADWNVAGVAPGTFLAHMRSFAAHASGIYELEFPYNSFNPGWGFGLEHPTNLRLEVENMLTDADTLVLGVHFDGSIPANVWLASWGNGYVPYTNVAVGNPTAGLAEVIASPGQTYWQDSANNRVWIKLRGGSWQPGGWADFVLTPDMLLYETTYLRIAGP